MQVSDLVGPGKAFPTQKALAEHHGVKPCTVCLWQKRGIPSKYLPSPAAPSGVSASCEQASAVLYSAAPCSSDPVSMDASSVEGDETGRNFDSENLQTSCESLK